VRSGILPRRIITAEIQQESPRTTISTGGGHLPEPYRQVHRREPRFAPGDSGQETGALHRTQQANNSPSSFIHPGVRRLSNQRRKDTLNAQVSV
jgi:hypothetical protein